MKFSVVIPAYNAVATVAATIESALNQTQKPFEILVLDDGSTDKTSEILNSYKNKIRIFRRQNDGVASARNFLCRESQGDVIAFLDSDDLWHPNHLQQHLDLIVQFPMAAGYFTYHHDFVGYGNFNWPSNEATSLVSPRSIPGRDFVKQCNSSPMKFQMSCCTMPRKTLKSAGGDLFCFSGGEDTYFHHLLALSGCVGFSDTRTVAYRVNPHSLSANRLNVESQIVAGLRQLDSRFKASADVGLFPMFRITFAARLRLLGRLLMGTDRKYDARREIRLSIRTCLRPASVLKSICLLLSTYLPRNLQPRWPAGHRNNTK